MAFISLGKIDKNMIPIIVGCIFTILIEILFLLNNFMLSQHIVIVYLCDVISKLLIFIPFVIFKIRSKKVHDKPEIKDDFNFEIYPIIQSVCSYLSDLNCRLGVIATPATVNSHAYSKQIAKYNDKMPVFELAAPNWVRIVEEHRLNQPQSILQVEEILDEMRKYGPDKIVLACTHYPYLMDILKKFEPEGKFIDPSIHFAKIIKNDLEKNNMLNDRFEYEKFYVSSDPENFKEAAKLFYALDMLPNLIS